MIQLVSMRFLERIISEQESRDAIFNCPGNFAENALIEHVFRYWLESVLASLGATNIEREAIYPGATSGRGRKPACDLICNINKITTWIELKVAYADTGYTNSELLSDFEKLDRLKDVAKLYITVFVTPDSTECQKMSLLLERAEILGASTFRSKHPIPVPTCWTDWKTPHVQVICHYWL